MIFWSVTSLWAVWKNGKPVPPLMQPLNWAWSYGPGSQESVASASVVLIGWWNHSLSGPARTLSEYED